MPKKQPVKNQHYVPQFLLRRFTDENGQMHVYDKHRRKSFVSSTRNVASENYFYDFKVGDTDVSFDPAMDQVEGVALDALNSVADSGSISHLDDDGRARIALFMAVQMRRTRGAFEGHRHLLEGFQRAGTTKGITPQNMPDLFPSDSQIRQWAVENIGTAEELAPHFLTKDWVVYRDPGRGFLISDHPIVLSNVHQRGAWGNDGLACRGIQIFLPLSTEFTLACLCPTIAEDFREYQRSKVGCLAVQQLLLSGIDSGSPVDLPDACVPRQNFLQAANAHRFVFSASDDFSLVEDILDAHPELARPKYVEVR